MICNDKCIWFQIYNTYNGRKITCDKNDKLIKDIPLDEKECCKHYKTLNDIRTDWKNLNL